MLKCYFLYFVLPLIDKKFMYILQAIFTEDLPYFRVKVNIKKNNYSIYLIDTYSKMQIPRCTLNILFQSEKCQKTWLAKVSYINNLYNLI